MYILNSFIIFIPESIHRMMFPAVIIDEDTPIVHIIKLKFLLLYTIRTQIKEIKEIEIFVSKII